MTPWRDPVIAEPLREALAHPWRTLGEALALVVVVAAWLAIVVMAWAVTG